MYKFTLNSDGIGTIRIDIFEETFNSDFSFWSKTDYEKHWKTASMDLVSGAPVIFITSLANPESGNYIWSWLCYKIGEVLVFQQRIIFVDDSFSKFDLRKPHKIHAPYRSVSEDGAKISEWRTNI